MKYNQKDLLKQLEVIITIEKEQKSTMIILQLMS